MAYDGRKLFRVMEHEPKIRCYQDMGIGTCRRLTFMHASVVLFVSLSSLSGGEHHHQLVMNYGKSHEAEISVLDGFKYEDTLLPRFVPLYTFSFGFRVD